MVLQVLRTALCSGTKCGSEVVKQLRHTDACAQPLLSADSMGEGVDSLEAVGNSEIIIS